MSDPFDDDDDLFDNPETLGLLEAVEERAIQASQKPVASKPRFSHPVRHVLAKPKNSPSSSATSSIKLKKEPRPINTEPGIKGTGFGWEIGGKRSIDVDRHIDNVKKREAYWSNNNGNGNVEEDESIPIDVIMDGSGKYELSKSNQNITRNGSGDEAIITDKRRAQPSMLGESLGLNGPSFSNSQQFKPVNNRKQSEDAINARRKAIAAATSTNTPEPFIPRQPISRSNSSSSTNIHVSNNNSRPIINNNQNQAQPQIQNNNNINDQKFGTNRSLSRSLSAGAQIFNRSNNQNHTNAIAGPSRLPTIPSQSQSLSQNGTSENGDGRDSPAPPMSQGSVARAAAIELDIERRKRQELEAELANLRAQANKPQPQPQPQSQVIQRQTTVQGNMADTDKKVKELQSQVWAAKGEAEMIRRAQKEEHQRHVEELERLKLVLQDKDAQIKEKENQAKKQVENIKHQAVFSNHAAHNSAMKIRPPQSQRFPGASQSQYRGYPTPSKNGSPSRRRSGQYDEEITPLIKSVKGKGKAPISGPVFGGFNNAFSATPTIGPRAKRQKTADLSPQASPTRVPSPSPFRASPARSQRKSSPVLGEEEGDDGIDWGPAIGPDDQDIPMNVGAIEEDRKDERAELLYHLLNHVSLSTYQFAIGLTTEPTLYRLMSYRPPIHIEGHEIYTQRCSDILKACGDPELSFDDLVDIAVNSLSDMLEYVTKIVLDIRQLSLADIAALCNILTLLSSSTLLFPSYIRTMSQTNITEILKSITFNIFADTAKLNSYKDQINFIIDVQGLDNDKDARDSWFLELADKVAELAEIICFVSETSIWKGDELVDIILGLTSSQQDPYIAKRGLELFYVASRQPCHFRSLITSSDKYKVSGMPNESPLIERLSRYLINPHSSASESETLQMSLLTVRGLCMLSISHSDAVIITGQKSILVPALVIVLQRESTKLYGIHGVLQSYKDALSLLQPTLSLLHHLVFPFPLSITNEKQTSSQIESQGQAKSLPGEPQQEEDNSIVGIDLPERINSACQTREFNGLQHMFVSSLGIMSYSQIDEEIIDEIDQRGIQSLSGDLLENVVEGPEGDAIYELYVSLDDEEGTTENVEGAEADNDNMDMEIDGQNDQVDMEVYKEMGVGDITEIIEIDDDD